MERNGEKGDEKHPHHHDCVCNSHLYLKSNRMLIEVVHVCVICELRCIAEDD